MRFYRHDQPGGISARRNWRKALLAREAGNVDIEALARDRDQLFAEAFKAYRNGEPWWPDKVFERVHVEPEQEARFEIDAWEESISTYLGTQSKVTIGQVARGALGIDVARLGRAEQNRIGASLQRLGWKREPKKDWQGKRWWSR